MRKTLTNTIPPKPNGDLCITGLAIITDAGTILKNAALVIRQNKVVQVGPPEAIADQTLVQTAIDGRGFLVIPGLVNAHTHAAMGFFRGLGHGRDNMIETFLFPAEKSLTPELLAPLSYSYIAAGLKAGITCFADHYYFVAGVAQALDELGARGVVGETVADLGGAFPGRQGFTHWQQTIEKWPFSSRISPAIAPHAADTVSLPLLTELASFAKTEKLPLHMHLSQTQGERERVKKLAGMSPVQYTDQAGALTPQTLAVHLVSADDADLALLAARGVTAGYCPASQIIYERLAPIEGFAKHQIPVALGTDCAASNDGCDLLSEMKIASLLAKDRRAPHGYNESPQIFAQATINGAKALGLEQTIGTIAPGKAADLAFLEIDLTTEPMADPLANLIFSFNSRHVRHVMIDGRFVVYNRELTTKNESDLREAYNEAVQEINRRLVNYPSLKEGASKSP